MTHPAGDVNLPFAYLQEHRGIDTAGFERVAVLVFDLATELAERFAADLNGLADKLGRTVEASQRIQATAHTVHCFFDMLLVQFATDITRGVEREAFSACLDGIHWVHFGQPSQQVVESIYALWVNKERCYQATFIGRAGEPTYPFGVLATMLQFSMHGEGGAIENQYLGTLLISLLEFLRKELPPQIAAALRG